jgi:hypothetical protein
MKASRSFFTGLWMKMMTTPVIATSFLPRKKIPRLLLQMMIRQQENTFMADRHLQRTMRIPGMMPVVAAMMAMTVAALAAAMATATTTQRASPVRAPQDPRDLLVVVHRAFRHCAQSR